MLTKEMERPRFEECKRMLQIIPATCVLSAQARTLICSKGICAPPSVALAAMVEPPPKQLKAGLNAFIIDSGSGQHLIKRSMVASEEHIKYCEEELLLQTANGLVKSHLKNKSKHKAIRNQSGCLDIGQHTSRSFDRKTRRRKWL